MKIIYSDNSIIVCIKPSGINSQDCSGTNMISMLKKETGCESIYPVHRLDKETSGLMVYAISEQAAANLSAQIADKQFKKKYFTIINGVLPEKENELTDLLFHDRQRNKTFTVKRKRNGVKEAKLKYYVISEKNDFSLLCIELFTGRTHQIRVQFSSRNHPISGDGKYGGGSGKLALFSGYLEFSHPISGEKMKFSQIPCTEIYPFNLFKKELEEYK